MDNRVNLEGSVMKNFSKYVSFNIYSMLAASICLFVDAFFISIGIGADGLTALSLASPIFALIFGIGLMIGVGASAKFATLRAEGETNSANEYFSTAIKVSSVMTILLSLTGIFLSSQISSLLGAKGYILPMTEDYVRVILVLAPVLVLYSIFESFTRNDGSPKVAMISGIIFYASNIVMDYFFIIVFDWGMFGAALATTVAPLIALCYLLIYWWGKKANFKFVKTRLEAKKVKSIFGIGGNIFIREILGGLNIFLFNLVFMQLSGNLGVAAFGIVTNLSYVVKAVYVGLSQGIQPLLSFYYGIKDRVSLYKVLKYSFVTSSIISVVVISAIWIFTDPITSLLNHEGDYYVAEQLSALANEGARIFFTVFLFYGFTYIIISFLSVTGAAKNSLVLSFLLNGAVIIPLIFILPSLFGVTGAWLVHPVTGFLAFLIAILFLIRIREIHRKYLVK